MRQKVYEKARAAIQRQIDAANPPLAESVVSARLAALEDAISRTEAHYIEQEQGAAAAEASAEPAAGAEAPQAAREPAPPPADAGPSPAEPAEPDTVGPAAESATPPPAQQPAPPQQPPSPAAEAPAGPPAPEPDPVDQERATEPAASVPADQGSTQQPPQAEVPSDEPRPSEPDDGLPAPAEPSSAGPDLAPPMPGASPRMEGAETAPGQDETGEPSRVDEGEDRQPFIPAATEEPESGGQPPAIGAPFIVPGETPEREPAVAEDEEPYHFAERRQGREEGVPRDVRVDDEDGIPEADITAPRYPARRSSQGRGRSIATAAIVVLVLGGLGTAGWIFRDEIEALLVEPAGIGTIADQAAEPDGATPEGVATPEGEQTEAATSNPDAGTAQDAATPAEEPESTRRFTQRLLPDGSEVDAGPAEPMPNAFDEGTNIAAAEPVASPSADPAATPTVQSEIGENPAVVGDENGDASAVPGVATEGGTDDAGGADGAEATDSSTPDGVAEADGGSPDNATGEGTEVAALDVAQKAVFYQERTGELPGTQESGNVVWSVIEEPPVEGQPPEPAIRAVADVPDENLKMTMTIRRNADPTLPASHVIELEFDTPPDFGGGSVTNVQRLALKDTEQARGEPLIGVAGKISDGFFIIALNNLDQAVQNNLALLESEQWIDIPLAYATGRRALISIEKGIPGDRVFKEALEAWDAKT
ncbi:hypothetical protein [Jiella marina]|uniref:hypothetical protein n=1 Tax=Jiella sp. LLJ827 TaxID=2917712 RepID=UPI002100A3C6|nr:hypothetical protein [Jiella sp. LLJ827]MCQ0989723.1 hypothetical protein [Jiella sp. LLJ827]